MQQFLFRGAAILQKTPELYHEFLNTGTLRTGIYTLATGATDPQKPHTQDEIYYVITGSASVRIDRDAYSVQTGDVVFVPAFMEHHFYDIVEELRLLVFFSKAQPEGQESDLP